MRIGPWVCAILACVSVLRAVPSRRTPVPFPKAPDLTGPYGVGRREYVWTDVTRPAYGEDAKQARRLVVWIWYPATTTDRFPSLVLPPTWRDAVLAAAQPATPTDDPRIKEYLARQKVYFDRRTHAVEGAPAVAGKSRFPVLFFSPGGSNLPTDYSYLIEDLVSHGFVVVGINPTGFSAVTVFPSGEVVRQNKELRFDRDHNHWLVEDIRFGRDRIEHLDSGDPLAGRLDLQHVGVFGHSYGGTTAVEVCHGDPRFTAGVNLDGGMYSSSVGQPFLLVNAHSEEDFDSAFWRSHPDNRANALKTVAAWGTFLEESPKAITVTIHRTNHGSFLDESLDQRPPDEGTKLMDGRRALRLIGDYLVGFFETYLKGRHSPLLATGNPSEPEVTIERNRVHE